MKSLIVAAFALFVCVLAHAQESKPLKDVQANQSHEVAPPDMPDPLFLLSEGGIKKEISKDDLEKLSITQIASIEVLIDNDSIQEYGEKGKNGVMIICLKDAEL